MTRRLPPPLVGLVGPWFQKSSADSADGKGQESGLVKAEAHELIARARSALGGGLRGLLLRVPELDDGAALDLAQELRALLTQLDSPDTWLGLHDRPHLVAAAGADAVHLGFRSLSPARVRGILGPDTAIGFSSHAGDGPQDWRGADYLFHGPVFATPSKTGLVEPLGASALRAFAASCDLPVWALGGITRSGVAHLADGFRPCGVALLSGIIGAPDPGAAAAEMLTALGSTTNS